MAETIREIIAQATVKLKPITETPRLEAELLLSRALGISRASLLSRLADSIELPSGFTILLERRLHYEPLSYIFGEWEFFGLPFYVRPPLLTPRPETEHLVEVVLEYLASKPSSCIVVDVGCGTGCVGVSLAHYCRNHTFYAVDSCRDALETTYRNAFRHEVVICGVQASLLDAFEPIPIFDVVVSNPPYVPEGEWETLSPVITRHEDPRALLAGRDGLDVIRQLIPQAKARLRHGGLIALEIGEDQYDKVRELLATTGFTNIGLKQDLGGIQRIIFAIA